MSGARDEKAALAAALFDDADALISRIEALEKALPESISNASRNVAFQLSQIDANTKQLSQLAATLQNSIQQHASVAAASEVAKAASTFRSQVAASSTDEVRSQILPVVQELRQVVATARQKRQSIFWPACFAMALVQLLVWLINSPSAVIFLNSVLHAAIAMLRRAFNFI
jgi:hypothetical protein